MANNNPKFAHISWSFNDVVDIAEECKIEMSREEVEDFMATHESDLQDAMIAHGWEAIKAHILVDQAQKEEAAAEAEKNG